MDKILFRRMAFYAYHGVYPEENALGQRFYVDLEIGKDLSRAGKSDDLRDTVDYAQVYASVKRIVEEERFKLLEALAEKIAARLLSEFAIEEILVRITKPDPPIPGHYESVAVEIRRSKR
ncbi:dihydroneopterin aldolase [Bacillaceae bacterium]